MNKNHGPMIFENYKSFLTNKEKISSYANEYTFYSDAHITGELVNESVMGPYKLLNLISSSTNTTNLIPSITFRVDYFLSNSESVEYLKKLFKENKTKKDFYHGGYIQDELAALISLFMGMRIKSGKISRDFYPDCDPRGKPRGPKQNSVPILFPPINQKFIIPEAYGTHSLNQAEKYFANFFKLQELDAWAIIQSARYYQEALWVAESSPQLSWLYFTSAIERAADHWNQQGCSSLEAFRESNEIFYKKISSKCAPEVLSLIVKEFGKIYKKQTKFTRFLIHFISNSLEKSDEISKYPFFAWNETNLKKALQKIYDHRSSALHGCIPFPLPMCEPPNKINSNEKKYSEIPIGLSMGTYDSVWMQEDTPMLLHTFEYLVRNAILKWIEWMMEAKTRKIK